MGRWYIIKIWFTKIIINNYCIPLNILIINIYIYLKRNKMHSIDNCMQDPKSNELINTCKHHVELILVKGYALHRN